MTVALPRGFRFAGVSCGIKSKAGAKDLSIVVSDLPAVAAGVYTQNAVYAAPVAVDRERTPTSNLRVVVTNSGNANACTGQRGVDDARKMAGLAATACGAEPEQALVMSTGIIGHYLPMDRIEAGIQAAHSELQAGTEAFLAASDGILTTDKSRKIASRTIEINGQTITLVGMAKGAGMIGPRMATMLSVIATDATLVPDVAQAALKAAVEDSFNCISVEGHMSTNDTVLLVANGASGVAPLQETDLTLFQNALNELCIELACKIPDDGEGSTHLVTIEVSGAASREDAFRIAKTVAESALVKTAVTGGDPNWGRIVSAAGYAGARFTPEQLSLRINGTLLFKDGAPVEFDESDVSKSMQDNRETNLTLVLTVGDGSVRFWTSDLTTDYVKFNADYST